MKVSKNHNFDPLFDKIIVRRTDPEAVTKSGIIIPQQAQEDLTNGEVVSVGPDVCDIVKVGDIVHWDRYVETSITVEDQELFVIRDKNILGVEYQGKARV